ncbi:MAG: hypothetical protein COV07_03935 [Candidatus Vogelbacteria bacterium CG10_big_fil_rev_8_21_14_0_10_45_14]|uniref:Uncharacterized protein n=1 Tax=Candidatus Vogelbacteria bacterium CG10_big_fil_rev_8_21_14_0_10_45_14 TaxID=1975042 RepID=A0A2H0RL82_9BACT|nr:MAG: hypothetical protein COV07_03935 [Candidatus Vogelbacteria bacterium CG10_big_fil_rev_8_21_14_0_10_45_14]
MKSLYKVFLFVFLFNGCPLSSFADEGMQVTTATVSSRNPQLSVSTIPEAPKLVVTPLDRLIRAKAEQKAGRLKTVADAERLWKLMDEELKAKLSGGNLLPTLEALSPTPGSLLPQEQKSVPTPEVKSEPSQEIETEE